MPVAGVESKTHALSAPATLRHVPARCDAGDTARQQRRQGSDKYIQVRETCPPADLVRLLEGMQCACTGQKQISAVPRAWALAWPGAASQRGGKSTAAQQRRPWSQPSLFQHRRAVVHTQRRR